MSKLSYKVSYYALYAMFAIILIVLGLFYLGGDAQGADVIAGVDPEMWQPANTNALLMLIYGLFGLAVAATVVAAVFQFGAALKDSPANAIKSLLGLVLLVVVIKKKISNKKAISAVELELISGTFLFPFAILITYLIEYPQLITIIFSLYHSQ